MVFIEDQDTPCENNRSFPSPSPNIVTMFISVINQLDAHSFVLQ